MECDYGYCHEQATLIVEVYYGPNCFFELNICEDDYIHTVELARDAGYELKVR